jgi:hypothetical protein
VNGLAFPGLNKLDTVYMDGNLCVNRNFIDSAAIVNLPATISSACSFNENVVDANVYELCQNELKSKNDLIISLNKEVNFVKKQIESNKQTFAKIIAEINQNYLVKISEKDETINRQISEIFRLNDELKSIRETQ